MKVQTRRRKNAEFTRKVITDVAAIIRKSKLSSILKVVINKRYQTPCRSLTFHSSWISSVSICMDYTPILIRSQYDDDLRYRMVGVSASSGPSLCVFDIELGKKLFDINGHASVVYSVAISRPLEQSETMPVIVSGSHDGLMKVWDLQSGNCVHEIGKHHHEGPVRAISVYEGLNPMVYSAASNTIWVWLLETAELITTVTHNTKPILCITTFRAVEAFADETRPAVIVSGSQDGTVAVFQMETYQLLHMLHGHTGPVHCVEVAKTNRPVLVSGGFDHTARVWDVIDGDLLYVIDDHHCPIYAVNILPTPRMGILLGSAEGRVHVYDIANGSLVFELLGHTGPVRGIASTLVPRPIIITGSHDGSVKVWDVLVEDKTGFEELHAASQAIKDVFEWKDMAAIALQDDFSDSDEEVDETKGHSDGSMNGDERIG